jgi:hypothetical protein
MIGKPGGVAAGGIGKIARARDTAMAGTGEERRYSTAPLA